MPRVALTVSIMIALLAEVFVIFTAVEAIKNERFTAIWDAPPVAVDRYEFRWKHFASANWIPLQDQAGTATTFTATFPGLPNVPTTDRWMCLDGRSWRNGLAGAWLSDTAAGAACAGVDVGTIVITPPPVGEPFKNLKNQAGVLSFEYRPADCKRGVQQSTGPLTNGSRTITLTCRK